MKLFEFEAKNILRKYGITIPEGYVASNPDEVEAIVKRMGGPVALKSQVLVSSRGKSGGIVFADNAIEARKIAANLIGSKVKGVTVTKLLVEEKIDIVAEFYASVAIDRQAKKYIVIASTSGGVDIEEMALSSPEKMMRHWVDPLRGFSKDDAKSMVGKRGNLRKEVAERFSDVIYTLYRIAMEGDAELVEINPLVKTASGILMACDARIIVDDNALFRHPEFEDRSFPERGETPAEVKAREQKLAYVELDGDIGIIGNGAGLVMATLDLVHLFGGKPANFLDIGGGARAEVIKRAVILVLSKPEVRAVLINIFGGVTRCDLVAQGIIQALSESTTRKPLVVRMTGTNEEEGTRILHQAGVFTYANMEEAIRKVTQV